MKPAHRGHKAQCSRQLRVQACGSKTNACPISMFMFLMIIPRQFFHCNQRLVDILEHLFASTSVFFMFIFIFICVFFISIEINTNIQPPGKLWAQACGSTTNACHMFIDVHFYVSNTLTVTFIPPHVGGASDFVFRNLWYRYFDQMLIFWLNADILIKINVLIFL